VSGISFNHAGDRLAAQGWSRCVELFDVWTGEKLLINNAAPLHVTRFSRDDRRLAGAVQDGKLGIWQIGDGREYRTLVRKAMPEKDWYGWVSVSPNGRLLAVEMREGVVLWDLAFGTELAFIPTGGSNNCVLFEPSGA